MTVEDAKTIDLTLHSRKILNQGSSNLETSLGVRLTYARWLIVFGLFAYYFLEATIQNKAFTLIDTPTILVVIYGFINLLIWGAYTTVGRTWNFLINSSLIIDVVFTTAISIFLGAPIFFFAYLTILLMVFLIGVFEGMVTLVVVGGINIFTVFFEKGYQPAQRDEYVLLLLGLLTSLVVLVIALFLITGTPGALLRVSRQMLEEAMARSNEESLQEMQNRVKAVYRVANTLSATLDYQQIVRAILREMESLFDVSLGAIILFEGSLSRMRVFDALGLTPDEEQRSLVINDNILKRVVGGGKPRLVSGQDLQDLIVIFPSMSSCQTAILLPLRAGIEAYGVLLLATNHTNAYTSSDTELMVILAAHSVLAMQNATLYRNLLEDRNKLLTQEEEVRHELARNLHDGPAQAVAAISMQTEFIRRLFRTEPDRALEELGNLGKSALQTSKEIRTLLFELRPLVLESQGLVPALEQYAKRFPTNPSDPQVHFSTANFGYRLSPQVESTIFTIIQEAVNNARKHARSRNIWLHLEVQGGFITSTIQDDGRGFDVAAVETNYEQRGSLGLTNMRERAALVNGQVTFKSASGQGTAVIISIPVNENTVMPAVSEAAAN